MARQVYMCLIHDEVFETLTDAKKHEVLTDCCAAVLVMQSEIEELRSIIYNDRLISRL
jgi:hypothetical protein